MEFEKVVQNRHSVRMFTDQPVERDVIKEIVSLAQRSPSWVNSQPWQVYCASGDTLQEIRDTYQKNDQDGKKINPDLAVMSRNDWAAFPQGNMKQWGHEIVHHFTDFDEAHSTMTNASDTLNNAPVILFITIPTASPDWSIFDAGAFAQTLLLAATNKGLGSVVTYNSVRFPDDLHRIMNVPEDQRFMAGVSIGYPAAQKINDFRSDREPLDKLLHFS